MCHHRLHKRCQVGKYHGSPIAASRPQGTADRARWRKVAAQTRLQAATGSRRRGHPVVSPGRRYRRQGLVKRRRRPPSPCRLHLRYWPQGRLPACDAAPPPGPPAPAPSAVPAGAVAANAPEVPVPGRRRARPGPQRAPASNRAAPGPRRCRFAAPHQLRTLEPSAAPCQSRRAARSRRQRRSPCPGPAALSSAWRPSRPGARLHGREQDRRAGHST
mmetsp:Transcript_90995/g.253302  ORF Transcript_90995/g.253302 Transcript_90995/m.253302 type:complete len:217 (-) Transcript_90995:1593-2243(-)